MNQEAITQLKGMLPKHREKPKSEPTPEELLAKARVTPMTELPALDNLFEIGDTPCFYRGELVASCGKAKSGKTLFQSIIMAGTLRHETLFLKRKEESDDTGHHRQPYHTTRLRGGNRGGYTEVARGLRRVVLRLQPPRTGV